MRCALALCVKPKHAHKIQKGAITKAMKRMRRSVMS